MQNQSDGVFEVMVHSPDFFLSRKVGRSASGGSFAGIMNPEKQIQKK